MRTVLAYAGIGVLVGLILSFSYSKGLFFGTEHFFGDLLASERPVDERLVILAIDDASLKKIGQWPWPRKVFADAFSRLGSTRPLAVGFDVLLAEPSRLGGEDDQVLTRALERVSYPLVFPVEGALSSAAGEFFADRLTYPREQFLKNTLIQKGHINLILDPDGVVRRLPRVISSDQGDFSALSYLLALEGGAPEEKKRVLPIAYAAAPGKIRNIPFYRLLDEDLSETLKGKIVLIGATAPDLHDEKPTPLGRGTEMPGVEIQANAANMFLKGYRTEPLSSPVTILLILIVALIPALFHGFSKHPWRPLVGSIGFGFLVNLILILLYEYGTPGNFVHMNLAWMAGTLSSFAYRHTIETRERRELRNAFSKYVSPSVLDKILENPAGIALGGEEKTVTVLFSDIRGFTTLSEKTTPQELVSILNRYFTLMTGEILKHGGVLDKYIGDAVMAFWGAPLPDSLQADHAVAAAQGMLVRLKEFNKELKREKGIEIDIGIGLYTGPAVAGNIGSDVRFDYTVMGDTVNIASRLEGLNKEHGTHLIIGETTRAALTKEIPLREMGEVTVKGRGGSVLAYALAE